MATESDVIIVGGGVIGLACADALQQAGCRVTLLDRSVCGRESSWAGAGVLQPASPHRRGPIQNMMQASLDLYPQFCADVQERSGVDPEYDRCGMIDMQFDEQRHLMAVSEAREFEGRQTPDGHPLLELLSREQVQALEPSVTTDFAGAMLCRRSAQVRPPRLTRALRAAFEAGGGRVIEAACVRQVRCEANRATGVVTETATYAAEHVVICAGAWSGEIASAGHESPTLPVRGQFVILDASDCPVVHIDRVIDCRQGYLLKRRDGLVYVGATSEPDAGFSKRNTSDGVHTLLTRAMRMVPGLADCGIRLMSAGLRPSTPDHRPYVGPSPSTAGLWFATGHYRMGVTLAPVTAEIIRDLITQGATAHDLSRCAPGRRP